MKFLKVLSFGTLLTMTSCFTGIPITVEKANNNKTYQVEYLFEHDGCKVYRFDDRGHYVYFTNCKGDITSIENDSTANRITNHVEIIAPKHD